MKVILLQDIARIGYRFEIKDVPDGHALNFLIPKKLAEPATKENIKRIEARKKVRDVAAAANDDAFKETLSKLDGQTLEFAAEANKEGGLFQGLKADAIAAHVAEITGPLAASDVKLEQPIKMTGDHEIALERGALRGGFTLRVVSKA